MQLSVPNRTAPISGSFNSNPNSVKEWIERLPMANIGETTKLLFEALTDLNRQEIAAQQRFKTLQMLRRPVAFVSDSMVRHFVGKSLPLSEKNLKIAHLSREIIHALATGYKVLVMEQIAGGGRKDKKLLITAIHRAIKLQGQVLLRSCQVYEPYPEGAWLEIHSLYRHAESNRLHKTKVADDAESNETLSTITDVYKQILLLALACPYRLRHGEAATVYQLLEEWAAYAELELVGQNGTTLFSTNLDSDQPPTYLVLRSASENRETCRALNTTQLAEQVRKALTLARSQKKVAHNEKLSTSTLRHLMLAWGIMPKRRFSRAQEHSAVVVAMGLSSIHYFVSGEVAFSDAPTDGCDDASAVETKQTPQFQDRARFHARETDGRTPDIWDITQHHGRATQSETIEIMDVAARSSVRIDPSHKTHNWKMVNVSAGGYCLLWDNLETTRSQVGELLGIREQSDPDTFHWSLGVIRWLKFADTDGLQLGVQMLSPGAVAIAALKDNGKKQDGEYTRGLLLPEIASLQQRATMLLPSPPFKVGDTVRVNCQGKNIRAKLTKLLENTGSFAQFQFSSLGEVSAQKPEKPKSDLKPKDFDDVWELL